MLSIYWILLIILTISSVLNYYCENNKSIYCLVVSALILIAGFRSEVVGRDYVIYREYFENAPTGIGLEFIESWYSTLSNVDILFVYFNSIVKQFAPFEIFILLLAFLSITLYSIYYYINSPYPFISLLIYYSHYFFYREMIQIRSGLACAVLLWCYYYFSKSRFFLSLVLFCITITIHLSTLPAIFVLMATKISKEISLKSFLFILISCMFLSIFFVDTNIYFGFIDRLDVYQDSEYVKTYGIFSNPITIKQILISILAIVFLSQENHLLRILSYSYILSTFWIVLFSNFELFGARGASYLSVGEPVLIAAIIYYFPIKFRRLVQKKLLCHVNVMVVLAFCTVVFFVNIEVKNIVNDYVITPFIMQQLGLDL